MESIKTKQKKAASDSRINKLDPNNNRNKTEKPLVKRSGKTVFDDGFEHRTSDELVKP